LIESSTDITGILGKDGTIKFISPSVERGSGYKPEEMVGKKLFDYLLPEDVEKTAAAGTNSTRRGCQPEA
jgi:PAS domain S-box-containing protein